MSKRKDNEIKEGNKKVMAMNSSQIKLKDEKIDLFENIINSKKGNIMEDIILFENRNGNNKEDFLNLKKFNSFQKKAKLINFIIIIKILLITSLLVFYKFSEKLFVFKIINSRNRFNSSFDFQKNDYLNDVNINRDIQNKFKNDKNYYRIINFVKFILNFYKNYKTYDKNGIYLPDINYFHPINIKNLFFDYSISKNILNYFIENNLFTYFYEFNKLLKNDVILIILDFIILINILKKIMNKIINQNNEAKLHKRINNYNNNLIYNNKRENKNNLNRIII